MNIKYHRINENELNDLPFSEGSMYFCKDTGKLYADPIGGGVHTLINDCINDDEISNSSTWSSDKINGTIKNKANELNQSITTVQNNLNTAKTELSTDYNNKIKNAAPINLLDNSDFTNPVAQAGIKGYHGNQIYAVDRWKLVSGNIAYDTNVNGLTIKGKLTQTLEHIPEGPITLFVEYYGDNLNYSYDNGVVTLECTENAIIKWAALYEGEYTEETMPVYKPKGYVTELAECQRYYRRYTNSKTSDLTLNGYVTGNTTKIVVAIPDIIPMRIDDPTVTFNGDIIIRSVNGYATDASNDNPCSMPIISLYSESNYALQIYRQDNAAWGLTNNTVVSIQFKSGYVLEFSADL